MPPAARTPSDATRYKNGRPRLPTREEVIAKAVAKATFEPTVGSKQAAASHPGHVRKTLQAHKAVNEAVKPSEEQQPVSETSPVTGDQSESIQAIEPKQKDFQGFIPSVPIYHHFKCISKYALARLADPSTYQLSRFINNEQETGIKDAISDAVSWVAKNPRQVPSSQEINAPLNKSSLTKRQLKCFIRSGKKSAAAFHAEHTALSQHLRHRAERAAKHAAQKTEKKLMADARMAREETAKIKAEAEKIEAKLTKTVEEKEEMERELKSSKGLANLLSGLLSRADQRRLAQKLKKRLSRAHGIELQDMVHFDTMQLHTLILHTHEVIQNNASIRGLIRDAIEKAHPGEGDVYVKKIEYRSNKGPHGYIRQDFRGESSRNFIKSFEKGLYLVDSEVDWKKGLDGKKAGGKDAEGPVEMEVDELENLIAEAAQLGTESVLLAELTSHPFVGGTFTFPELKAANDENLEDDPPDAMEGDNAEPLNWDDGFVMDKDGYAPVSVSHTDHMLGISYDGLPKPPKRAHTDETPTVCDIHPTAGKVVGHVQTAQEYRDAHPIDANSRPVNLYEPFTSELDWMVAKWLIQDSPGKSASDRLLKIPGFVDRLGLSFHNMDNLHKKIDGLPGMAPWHETTISLADEPDESHLIQYCDPIDAIKSLWGNPTYAKHLVYAPMKMWSNLDRDSRLYNEMWTGKWWWTVQELLSIGATIVPVIISTDKTQLTNFCGSKQAYPVYLTIGNIPRAIWKKPTQRACVLLAYLSTDKITSANLSSEEIRHKTHHLFHESMKYILKPLEKAGREGVDMTGGDGNIRNNFSIVACYPADYPEQCLATCVKYGGCIGCDKGKKQVGDPEIGELCTSQKTLDIIDKALNHPRHAFHTVCQDPENNLNGHVHSPFWENLPYLNIHASMTPEVLHQLHGGVFKHVLGWCQQASSQKGLDQRIKSLPPSHGIQHFPKGISTLKNVSGTEQKQMTKILLGVIANTVPKGMVIATWAILDFTYIAQYPSHSEGTLGSSIINFGATDNYSTELFERLHINFAKQAFRASNRKEERPQMLKWLDRQEKTTSFQQLLALHTHQEESLSQLLKARQGQPILLAKAEPFPNRNIDLVMEEHRAPWFTWYLKEYLYKHGFINTYGQRVQDYPLPFSNINVWTTVRLCHQDIQGLDKDKEVMDSFHASPERIDNQGRVIPAHFDTVLVEVDQTESDFQDSTSLDGTRAGRVKIIFSLPRSFTDNGHGVPCEPLAFVEWYTRVRAEPDTVSKFYEVKKHKERGTGDIIDDCDAFYINDWGSLHTYQSVY
ncbi:hypothetical protein M0805_000569 [Coniferiporia weirii]|nr:hypothetical protein M0805_000569 [Coniferiporia weirii]